MSDNSELIKSLIKQMNFHSSQLIETQYRLINLIDEDGLFAKTHKKKSFLQRIKARFLKKKAEEFVNSTSTKTLVFLAFDYKLKTEGCLATIFVPSNYEGDITKLKVKKSEKEILDKIINSIYASIEDGTIRVRNKDETVTGFNPGSKYFIYGSFIEGDQACN